VGKNVRDIVPAEQRDMVSPEFPKVTSGEITEFESTSWTADGRAIPVEIRASHVTYNAKPALLLHVNDITERKHARELLEKRVDERTAELNAEITERKKTEQQLRAFQATLRSVASELNIAEEGERRRISQGIHDHIGQILAITKIKLGALRQATANTDNSKSIEDIRDLVNEVIQYTRTLTFELGSPILYELGLKAALESLAEHHEKQHGTRTSLTSSANGYDLPNDVRTVLYQAVRELLHNVAKHAEANSVMISIDTDEQNMRVNVDDNGSGFDVSNTSFEVAPTGGFGLFQLRERLDHLGGQLRIESTPGEGTRVSLIVPLKPQRDVMLGRGT
jgi:signal transduction histidine kinase